MKNINIKNLLQILFLLFVMNSYSQDYNKLAEQARNFYAEFFNEVRTPVEVVNMNKNTNDNFVVNFSEGGFIILHKVNHHFEVLSIKPKGKFLMSNKIYIPDISVAEKRNIDANELASVPAFSQHRNTTYTDVPNFMTNEWGSVNCIDDQNNIVNVTNYYTPSHCSAGCVAISTSQILHYYKWPIIGVGNNVYSDNYNGSLVRHGAFMDKENYDWANMLDRYMYVHSTDDQRKAAGKLVYDVAVALEMNFEPTGSTSNVNKVPYILANYFRYTGHYEDISWSGFWSKMYSSMQKHKPVSLPIEDSAGNGHAMVVSGYKRMNNKNYYYVNWGWYNSGGLTNGWENLQGWDNSTQGYNTILGALFDAVPEPEITSITPTGTGNDFTIHWEVSQNLPWEEFTLEEKIDNGNWHTLASGLTTQDYTKHNPTGNVYIYRVKAKSNGGYYLNSWSEQVPYSPTGSVNGFGSFEGSQYCYAKQTPGYDLIFNHDYTFETWIKLRSGNQNGDVIFDQNYIFSLEIEDLTSGDYSVVFKCPASQDALHSNASGTKLQIGQWHHIAVSTTGTTTRLFIDGQQRDINTSNHFHLNSSNNAINIGERYRNGNYSGYIKAYFDEIRFSNIGRYSADFTPNRLQAFTVDDHTKGYFRFQNVHRNRLKDEAFKMSFKVKNQTNYVRWKFEYLSPSAGVKDEYLIKENVIVYPNPSTDFIYVKQKNNELDLSKYKIELFDVNGRKMFVKKEKYLDGYKIDVNHLSKGNYLLILENDKVKASRMVIVNGEL